MTKEQYFPIAINMVNLIEEYCETYKEWPKQNNKENKTNNGTTSAKLISWLYTSGYMNGDFKYSSVLDNNGVTLKTRLDQLYSVYGRLSVKNDTFKIKIVESLIEYCETYKEWPKHCNKKQKTEKEIQGHRLACWLLHSNYYDDFKYKDIIGNDGISIKDKIDYYYNKYCVINKQSKQYKIQIIDLIEEYCYKYNEWPRTNSYNKKTSDGTTSHQLATWLTRNGYNCFNFKYADILDEKGVTLQERLDELFKQYGYVSRQSSISKVNMVEALEEYCNIYNEWPKESTKLISTQSGFTNKQIAAWLKQSGYYTSEFKYINVLDNNGVSIKERIDNLFQKYNYISHKSDNYKIQMVDLIEEYCETYKQWPKHNAVENKIKNGMNSTQLMRWLVTSGYKMGEFKYDGIVDSNGICLKNRLDKLYMQYSNKRERKIDNLTKIVNLIEEYCKLYETWPRSYNNGLDIESGVIAKQLAKWLNKSGYYTENFKYEDSVDKNGISIKKKLDGLFSIYANEYEIRMLEDKKIMDLNLFKAKDSDILGNALYYLAVKLKRCYDNSDTERFLYHRALFESKLKNSFIKFNVDEFLNSFFMPLSGRLDFYYNKWLQNYNENNYDLAILFRNLYNYENVLAVKPEENKTRKKQKKVDK